MLFHTAEDRQIASRLNGRAKSAQPKWRALSDFGGRYAELIWGVQRHRHQHKSLIHELLDSPAILDFRAVEVAFIVGGHVMEDVELARRNAGPSERVQRLQRLAVKHPDSRGASTGDVKETLRRVGREGHAGGSVAVVAPGSNYQAPAIDPYLCYVFATGREDLHTLAAAV